MLVLIEIGVFMLVVGLLNFLIHFNSYLSSWLLLVVSVWSPDEDSLLFFASLGIMVEYSFLNTYLYTL
jgi:hypothetical protein